jgi:hypothetical protein
MNSQRIVIGLLACSSPALRIFYMNWKTLTQLRTVKAFVETTCLPMPYGL